MTRVNSVCPVNKLFRAFSRPLLIVSQSDSVQEKLKIDLQHHSSHLGFPVRTILAIFDLLVTPMLPTEFQVNWPFGSDEAKNRLSR